MKAAESFVRARATGGRRGSGIGRHDHRDGDRCEHGEARARKPHAAPVAERCHQGRRHGDADADAREVQRRQAAASRGGQPVEHQGGAEDQAEGAGDAGAEPQHEEERKRCRDGHRHQADRIQGEARQQPGAPRAGQAHRRQQGAGEVTHEVGRGDQARLGLAEAERLDHGRQDGGVDEAADSDAGGHRQKAAEGQCERAFVHCRHGTEYTPNEVEGGLRLH